ncbi:Asp-tRNA(Asn)/Glu-tRNA(Gln) amidotransferase A subunit family amidase [Kibdelosporangium banguiense]|uniref:Asp-tRNA(Asn)/Glu-tRNA(Gln) amidotransferase A subunit family amidase n=1 Tax=Kibdelosporangium banguiense TaxID=1365924 RepID=A0ABS4TW66_9PSEU|nr:amidase [Kibdelosporangium banguiense]MBP2328166.1 Asp-tRNA(Asn)/Glu-tRNA(Gln) amidotransferase A subunit family amidase [Kibdelosporangium banguiense]
MPDELYWKTAAELGELYRRGEVSPVEVVDAALDRMDHVDPLLNIMVTRTADEARAQAKEAERRLGSGEQLPPLFGVPITVKDLAETAGVRTTYGCTAYAEYVPDEDAIGWARLKQQGVILLGKTTTPEFGLLGVTESKLTGSTSTPWRPGYNAGGSSGGAAAAVVSGVGPVAWGSDGGGSIRVPSSLCGAVGIKPSIGRIPTAGNTDGDTTDGPIARTVLDAALVFEVTNGHHPADRFSVPRDTRSYVEAARAPGDLTGVRVAACPDLGQKVLDPDVRAAFTQALEDMRAAGAVVEEVRVELPDTQQFFDHINGYEYLEFVEQMAAAGIELWPMCVDLAQRAKSVTGREVNRAFRQGKTDIYNAFATAMADADVLVTPTTPVPAFPHGGDRGPTRLVEGQEVPPLGMLIHSMTEPPSHAGLPALSVPCGFDSEGLPVGLQIIGHLWADADVVSIAARYERINEWHTRRPEL